MTKYKTILLPAHLVESLRRCTTLAVLTTFSEAAVPQAMPLYWYYGSSNESILIAIQKDCAAYYNMVWQKKAVLSFFDENISYSVLCRAGVVKAPSDYHPFIHILHLDVISIDNELLPMTKITSGIQWKYISNEAEELGNYIMQELKLLAR